MGQNFFVTTNIDKGLQEYLGLPDDNVSFYPDFAYPPKPITYLHGRINEPKTWIFTEDKYNEGYVGKKASCKKFLVKIFNNYNVLFIGYGLRERDIKRTIACTERRKTHYWLEGYCGRNQDDLRIRSTNLRETYDVILIPYSTDKEGYEALYVVLDSLYQTMTEGGE